MSIPRTRTILDAYTDHMLTDDTYVVDHTLPAGKPNGVGLRVGEIRT